MTIEQAPDSSGQLFRFAVVGVSNFIIGLLTFQLLLYLTDALALSGTISQTGSYLSGIIWSYAWNRLWTFKSQSSIGGESSRFLSLQIALMLTSIILVGIAVDFFDLHPTGSWIMVVFAATAANYLGMKHWVFVHR